MAVVEKKTSNQNQSGAESGGRLSRKTTPKRFAVVPFTLTFFIMFFFWVLFSGKFDPFHISFGIGSSLIVAAMSKDLLFPSRIKPGLIICWLRFAGYIPWLVWQIFLANLHVLYLVFHPRMMELIDPKIIYFNSKLSDDISRTTFANSITLTPGTITVHVSVLGEFAVHCIDEKSGRSLPGDMEKRIAKVFNE